MFIMEPSQNDLKNLIGQNQLMAAIQKLNGKVIMDVASSIKVLREEIESNIVPVRWLDLVSRSINMLEISWEWERGGFGIEHSHLSFEEFIFASIVIGIFIAHSQPGGE